MKILILDAPLLSVYMGDLKTVPHESSKKNNTERAYRYDGFASDKKISLSLTAQICYPVSDPPPADRQAPIGPAVAVSRALEKNKNILCSRTRGGESLTANFISKTLTFHALV